jgi:hypothetical protein
MAEKVDALEAEAEAGVELSGEMTGDTLQGRFKALETQGGADLALAELKAKMGVLAPASESAQKALPAGGEPKKAEEKKAGSE